MFIYIHAEANHATNVRQEFAFTDGNVGMGASEARIKLGTLDQTKKLHADDGSVTSELDLPRGPALLETWLKDAATPAVAAISTSLASTLDTGRRVR